MEYFDALEEVYAAIERYVDEHSAPPHSISVSPSLYRWLIEIEKEDSLLSGEPVSEPLMLPTSYGDIPVVIDEMLTPYEILPE